MRPGPKRRGRRGFTMIELMVVMVIIGIMLALILGAAAGAAREAESRATQALITKLEMGLNDRIEALLSQRVDPLRSHGDLAMVYFAAGAMAGTPVYTTTITIGGVTTTIPDYSKVASRAQAIALFDMYKAELPDVFFVQNPTPTANQYPINFAQQPYPGLTGVPTSYQLPIGTGGSAHLTKALW